MHDFERWSVSELLLGRARLSGDRPFLTFAPPEGECRRWSYAGFASDVASVAGGLAARGVARGDRVVVFADNCPEMLLTWFACAWLGAVCVPVNASSTTAELAWYLDRSAAAGVVTQPKLAGIASAALGGRWMVVTATDAEVPSSTPAGASDSFAALYRPPVAATPVSPRSPLTVLFTSGTTSRPKGVLWTHANGLWGARLGALQEALREDDVHFVFLPLFHVVALSWSILPTLWAGGSAVLVPRFSASRFWDTALAWRCTFASMVPFCTAALARQAVPERHHFRTWGHAIYSSDYERRFRVRLLGWWGMTEIVSQGIVGDFALPQTPGTIGRPSVAYPLEVVDDEGHAVEAGATGELRVHGRRGLSLFGEYLDDPEATREAFDAAGRFRTGDRVRVREGGAIEFVDRAKDVIRVGGEGVAAPEIERVISALAGVREVAVVARRHPLLGEEPVAFVRLDDGRVEAPAVVEAILTACRDQLAKFKVPREVRLVEEFPRAAIGKISKAELRRRLAEGA